MTKWRPNNKMTFQKWYDCDRCGLPWPLKVMRRQRGILVCPECWDKPSYEDLRKEKERESRDIENSRQTEPGESN